MNELTVNKVLFYGDETASVTLESDSSSVDVFCHRCEYKEGDKVNNLLQVLDAEVKAAYLGDWPVEIIKEKSQERLEKTGPYSYKGCGKVVDPENGIIEVKGFLIETNEILHCSAVEFEINRLDLW
tara:strand:- start:52 stop:429 length:378 start_codon:yes stop_codon:yes gene_type:complete